MSRRLRPTTLCLNCGQRATATDARADAAVVAPRRTRRETVRRTRTSGTGLGGRRRREGGGWRLRAAEIGGGVCLCADQCSDRVNGLCGAEAKDGEGGLLLVQFDLLLPAFLFSSSPSPIPLKAPRGFPPRTAAERSAKFIFFFSSSSPPLRWPPCNSSRPEIRKTSDGGHTARRGPLVARPAAGQTGVQVQGLRARREDEGRRADLREGNSERDGGGEVGGRREERAILEGHPQRRRRAHKTCNSRHPFGAASSQNGRHVRAT